MQDMFFGEIISFDEIISGIKVLEKNINQSFD